MKKHLLLLSLFFIAGWSALVAQTGSITVTSPTFPATIEAGTDLTVEITYTSDIDAYVTSGLFLTTTGTTDADWGTWQTGWSNVSISAATDGTATLTFAIPASYNSADLEEGVEYILALALSDGTADFANSNSGNVITITETTSIFDSIEPSTTTPAVITKGEAVVIPFVYSLADDALYNIKVALAKYDGYTHLEDIQGLYLNDVQGSVEDATGEFSFNVPEDLTLSADLDEGLRYVFDITLFGDDGDNWLWLGVSNVIDVTVEASDGSATSVDALGDNELKLYPNPANDVLNVEGLEVGDIISVYSMTGTLVKQIKVSDLCTKIGVAELAKGIYLVQTSMGTLNFVKN